MSMPMKISTILVLLSFLIFASCGDDNVKPNQPPQQQCTDADNDGVCDDDDCSPNNPLIFLNANCDDGVDSTYVDKIDENCECHGVTYSGFVDPRDNQTYPTIKIGDAVWFAKNLAYETDDSYGFGIDTINLGRFGRLYNWEDAFRACPDGWRLSTDSDWNILASFMNEKEYDGTWLKLGTALKISNYWGSQNIGATNTVGFNGVPAGLYTDDDGWDYQGTEANFWTSTDVNEEDAISRRFWDSTESLWRFNKKKSFYFSCRCVKN